MSSTPTTPTPPLTVGIDIGSCWTKIVLGPTASCEIVRNEVGGHATPTAVSFSSTGGRHVGATAQQKNALHKLNRLLEDTVGADKAEEDVFLSSSNSSFTRNDQGEVLVQDYPKAGETQAFTPAAIIAMLLGNVRKNVLAALDRLSLNKYGNDQHLHYALSIPPGMSQASQQALLDAAHAAGLGSTTYLVETTHCLCRSFQRKFPEYMDGRIVMFVDMADTQTTVSLLQMGNKEKTEDGETQQQEEAADKKEPFYRLLACKRNASLGAHSVDVRLWHHFQSTVKALQDISSQSSRSGQRLLEACGKMKQTLSQLTEAHTTVAHQDADVQLHLTRAQLAELCAKDAEALHDLLQSVLMEPAEDGGQNKTKAVDHVEILGGGVRIPWVKDAIRSVLSAPDQELRTSFDETACALGGALLLADKIDNDDIKDLFVTYDVSEESKQRREVLKVAEEEMAKQDDDFQAISDLKNKLESHILEMRSAQHGKHGSLLPKEGFQAYLDELDDWLFSEQAEQISKTDMEEKLQATISRTRELCAQYFEAVEQENQAKDKEMEEEAKKAQLERAGQEDEDDADHDTRRLPKKRRMEIVMKNKAEANELFSDGNYKFAAARYTKALAHCSKFIDLNPEDTEEVNALKVSLNLNLALAYTKLENHDQALRVCNDALALDGESVKALYRRASVYYEKKKWDLADKDIKKAASLAPEDKAVKKLQDRITAQIKKQKEKEKKMAQKMFG